MKCDHCGKEMTHLLYDPQLKEHLWKCRECKNKIWIEEKADEGIKQEDPSMV